MFDIQPLTGAASDLDPLIHRVGNRSFVLLGESSHGTAEFYDLRAEITLRLIDEKGFAAVAVEADWPDAYEVNRYVRGKSEYSDASEALGGFRRFPQWMWRNRSVVRFVERLRERNAACDPGELRAGFYGIDLYSLHTSIDAVLRYLASVDPEAARRARQRYGCFDHFGPEPQAYGYVAASKADMSCEDAVVRQLVELQQRESVYTGGEGRGAAEAFFYAEQNARLVRNAEEYYRAMFRGRASSWNLRDTHMADTLDALVGHLSANGDPAKVVVWAHNSHLGDARATEMGDGGELNVGQLVRERHGDDEVLIVGFTTYTGTVTAATDWDEPARSRLVRPALEGSVERRLHERGVPAFLLDLGDARIARDFREPMLERAIGVVYRPESERQSHYFHAAVADQFDFLIHVDETRAVEPLESSPTWETVEPPETYPSGI